MNILIIEDNIRISDNLNYILSKENYSVTVCDNGETGYYTASNNDYDLIVLDLMLPEMDGYEILEGLRANKKDTPILVLSAKGQVEDKVKALDLGADDYLSKPFAAAELLARIRSILRRKHNVGSTTIEVGELIVDLNKKEVKIGDKTVDLTQKEYEIVEFLAYNKDKVVSKVTLGEHIWGEDLDLYAMSNFIDVHIKNVRKKLEEIKPKKYIHTKRGLGFILSEGEVE
ncbi:MAG TPA: response regulator transcription factor [Spirochaetota bacterium]|nr:response regulator transcription factor [Spirochaetota bacterium]HOS33435.1 response regulator transcription factor [Spirochaetota bacterium]HOS54855.1 response regulator transcription factor [Spirochaetota bacterium]HPK62116.1 response regulator transcription factor [Spirochaetota bacterium]HQF77777.1 response regulator transcription factor [Spirochaetota bacterium]